MDSFHARLAAALGALSLALLVIWWFTWTSADYLWIIALVTGLAAALLGASGLARRTRTRGGSILAAAAILLGFLVLGYFFLLLGYQ